MARLSWPGWLVIYWDRLSGTGSWTPVTVTHLSTNRARHRLTLFIETNALTTMPNRQPCFYCCLRFVVVIVVFWGWCSQVYLDFDTVYSVFEIPNITYVLFYFLFLCILDGRLCLYSDEDMLKVYTGCICQRYYSVFVCFWCLLGVHNLYSKCMRVYLQLFLLFQNFSGPFRHWQAYCHLLTSFTMQSYPSSAISVTQKIMWV